MTVHPFGTDGKAKRKQAVAEYPQNLQGRTTDLLRVCYTGLCALSHDQCDYPQPVMDILAPQYKVSGAGQHAFMKEKRQGSYGAAASRPYLPPQSAQAQLHAAWGPSTDVPAAVSSPANPRSVADSSGCCYQRTAGYLDQGAALCDLLSSKLNSVITSIDGGVFSGGEQEVGKFSLGEHW